MHCEWFQWKISPFHHRPEAYLQHCISYQHAMFPHHQVHLKKQFTVELVQVSVGQDNQKPSPKGTHSGNGK